VHKLPFDKPGRFYRGNLHTHSTDSDGVLSPEDVCKFYRENGYDFLAVTDHFMERFDWPISDTTPYRNDDFTTIIGAELHPRKTEFGNYWHILAVGLPLDFAPYKDGETAAEVATRALAAGAFVALAHPQWYTLTEADVISLGDVHAIETFNSGGEITEMGDSWHYIDLMSMRGRRYGGVAGDDAHFNKDDYLGGWVMVRSTSLDPDALLEALKNGHYYSSTGITIHDVQITADTVRVRCSPAELVILRGSAFGPKGPIFAHERGYGLTEVELDRTRIRDFGRIIVRGADGSHAWTNPLWFNGA